MSRRSRRSNPHIRNKPYPTPSIPLCPHSITLTRVHRSGPISTGAHRIETRQSSLLRHERYSMSIAYTMGLACGFPRYIRDSVQAYSHERPLISHVSPKGWIGWQESPSSPPSYKRAHWLSADKASSIAVCGSLPSCRPHSP
jgi:hypothetical protein